MGKFKVEVRARRTDTRIARGTTACDLPSCDAQQRIPAAVSSCDNCVTDAEKREPRPKGPGRDPVARRDSARAPLTRER